MLVKANRTPVPINATIKPTIQCPGCGQLGTFNTTLQHDLQVFVLTKTEPPTGENLLFGLRSCPNPKCVTLISVVLRGNEVVSSYPAQRIDFDSSNIPQKVVESMEEAISSHSTECYIAAAIMVRKTLEELCRDRGAKGKTLKERIDDLKSKVILPQELLDGLHDLRLLGNDAAHVESKEYEQVTREEVELGIEIAKEILKAVYQYTNLIDKLKNLKKTDT
jgi:HEPN domain-containing protein